VHRRSSTTALVGLALLTSAAALAQTAYTVASPDGRTALRLTVDGKVSYSVTFEGKPALLESPIALEFKDAPPIRDGLKVTATYKRTIHSAWENPLGKRRHVLDNASELTVALQESAEPHRRIDLIARAYNDGVAFRYSLPRQETLQRFVLTSEQTQFRFAGDPIVWAANYGGYASPQESEFRKRAMAELPADSPSGTPLLVQARADCFVAITEADLQDWAGMYVSRIQEPMGAKRDGISLVTRLAPRRDGQGLVTAETPHLSPWRVLLIGRKPGDLVASDLILNLSEPCAIGDASWVKPGKCAWDHWWSGDVKMDTPTEKEYIQFAADMGIPYQLVDWQWYGSFGAPTSDITHVNPDVDMPELLRFAKERNVRLFVWLHSADVDRYLKAGKLDAAFDLYNRWGLAGVKIDFMDHDDQETVNWYYTIVQMAARHKLLVDFHGAYKPTGMQRTYPNQITREGVMGEEYDKFSTRVTPEHDCTLPFTRMLAGPMDYTPGGFLNRSRDKWKQTLPTEVQGTRCHELAKFVIFDSPLTVLCDAPDHYRNQPGLDFLRAVPTVWDDTRIVDGYPGEFVISARRSGKDWFVGGMTNWDSRTIELPLKFLGPGRYEAVIYQDAADADAEAEHLTESRRTVTAKDTMSIRMASGGGFAIHLRLK
jgi:alpha-glucosidase